MLRPWLVGPQFPDVRPERHLQQVDQPTQVISAWSATTVRTEHVEPVSQPLHRESEVKACLMGRIATSRLVNMLVCLTMKFCIGTRLLPMGKGAEVT